MRGVPCAGEVLGFDASFRQRLDVLACPRYGRRLTLTALIEDPAVIVRSLVHLGLPTAIPEARAPPLHLVVDAPPTEVAGDQISSTNPPDPAGSPSARQTCASASGITLDRSPPNGHARHNALCGGLSSACGGSQSACRRGGCASRGL